MLNINKSNNFFDLFCDLCEFWNNKNCSLIQSSQNKISSPLYNPNVFLYLLEQNKDINIMFEQKCFDFKSVECDIEKNFKFLQKFQVILFSNTEDIQKLLIDSLLNLGFNFENGYLIFKNEIFNDEIFSFKVNNYKAIFNGLIIANISYIENTFTNSKIFGITYNLDEIFISLNKNINFIQKKDFKDENYDYLSDNFNIEEIFKLFEIHKNIAKKTIEKKRYSCAFSEVLEAKYYFDLLNLKSSLSNLYQFDIKKTLKELINSCYESIIKKNNSSIDKKSYQDKMEIKNFMNNNTNFIQNKNVLFEEIDKIENETKLSLFLGTYTKDDLAKEILQNIEYPLVFMAEFSEEFIKLPPEIINDVLKKFQCLLLNNNKFIIIANKNIKNNVEVIKNNIQNLISKELSYVNFEFDNFLSENLEYKNNKLKSVKYYKNFGTMFDKLERIVSLSKFMCFWIPNIDFISTENTAKLCKINLLSKFSKINTDLEIDISKFYAKINGYQNNVCEAIGEYYKIYNNSDINIKNKIALIVFLADKIDEIIALSMSNVENKEFNNIYFLIFKLIIDNDINIPLNIVIHRATSLFNINVDENGKKQKIVNIKNNVIQLFKSKFIDFLLENKNSESKNLDYIIQIINNKNKKDKKIEKALNFNLLYKKINGIVKYIEENPKKIEDLKIIYKKINNALFVSNFLEKQNIFKRIISIKYLRNIHEKNTRMKFKIINHNLKMFLKSNDFYNYFNTLNEFIPLVNEILDKNTKITKKKLIILNKVKISFDNIVYFSNLELSLKK
jgi:glycyl-tRNA synthetase beta chain